MATKSQFDPESVDGDFYSTDPNQHGNSDYGRVSEGVGTNTYSDATSGMDMDDENRTTTQATREANLGEGKPELPTGENYGGTQEWDVDPNVMKKSHEEGQMMSTETADKLRSVPENPSDEALFRRRDATYLEPGDDPNKGYNPHHRGYQTKTEEPDAE